MTCSWCGGPLAYVHGHGACLDGGCAMFGLNQAECCDGETAAATASGQRATDTGQRVTGNG